jgi:hypothetical protein
VLDFLARAIRQENEIKRIQIGNEEVRVSLFADNMIPYFKDLQESTKTTTKTPPRSDKYFWQISRIQKKKKKEKKIVINLTKEIKYLYNQNYKALKKRN